MSWFRVDDGLLEHEKLEPFEGNADTWSRTVSVWLAIGLYSARNKSDGFISKARLRRLTPHGDHAIDIAEALCDSKAKSEYGMLVRECDGYRLHDWDDYQPTKAELEEQRKQSANRQRKWRKNHPAPVTNAVTNDDRNAVTNAVSDAVTNGPPAQPSPTHPSPQQQASSAGGIDVEAATRDRSPCDVPYVLKSFERYWREASDGAMPMGLNQDAHRIREQARNVIRWASDAEPDDPRAAVRASAHAFAQLKARDPSVRDPWKLWTSRPGTWVMEQEARHA